MGNTAEVVIKLGASGQKQVVSAIGGVTRGMGDLRSQVFNLRNLVAGLGVGLLVRDLTRASAEQRRSVMGLETAMRSMGRYTPELSRELQQVATDLQGVTNYGDEATLQGQKFLITYRDITNDLLPRSSQVMLDLAALMGGDVVSAANMLGKASMGMTGELRRVGITVDQATFKARGYAGVLVEIEEQVRGQARAMREASGPWESLGNAIGDVKEKAGDVVNEIFAPVGDELIAWVGGIDQVFADFKKSADFQEWADETAEQIIGGFERALIGTAEIVDEFGPILGNITNTVGTLWDGFKGLDPWVQQVGIVGALIGGRGGKAGLLALAAAASGEFVLGTDFSSPVESLNEQLTTARRELREFNAQLNITPRGTDAFDVISERALMAERNVARLEELQRLSARDGGGLPAQGNSAAALFGAGPAEQSAVDYVDRFFDAARQRAAEIRAAHDAETAVAGPNEGGGGNQNPLDAAAFEARLKEYEETERLRSANAEADEQMRMEYLRGLKRIEDESQQGWSEISEFGIQAAHNMQDAFAGFLFDPFEEGLDGMLSGFSDTLRRMAAEFASQQLLSSLFGGLAGSENAFMSSIGKAFTVKHDGGLVLHDGGLVPRFHSGGLMSDERPAILQTGERVLSRKQNRTFEKLAAVLDGHGGRGAESGIEIKVYNQGGSEVSVNKSSGADGKQIIEMFIRAAADNVARGGVLGNTISSTFGVSRQGVTR